MPAPDHRFWSLENVAVTPYVGCVSLEARRALSTMTAGKVIAFPGGEVVGKRLLLRP